MAYTDCCDLVESLKSLDLEQRREFLGQDKFYRYGVEASKVAGAVYLNHLKCLDFLIENGIDPNRKIAAIECNHYLIFYVVRHGSYECVELLINKYHINLNVEEEELNEYGFMEKIKDSESSLLGLASERSIKMFKLLLDSGVNIREYRPTGPIRRCIMFMGPEIASLALEYGADPNLIIREGKSYLHYFSMLGSWINLDLDILKLLLKYGASPLLKDDKGQTPIELTKNLEIVNIIKSHLQRQEVGRIWDKSKTDLEFSNYLQWPPQEVIADIIAMIFIEDDDSLPTLPIIFL